MLKKLYSLQDVEGAVDIAFLIGPQVGLQVQALAIVSLAEGVGLSKSESSPVVSLLVKAAICQALL